MKHEGYNEFRQRGRFDFPIEFHHVDFRHPRFAMPYHWHVEQEIDFVLQGGLKLALNEKEVTAQAGDVIFIRDGIVHGGRPQDENTVYECLVFDMGKLLQGNHALKARVEAVLAHDLLINAHIPQKTLGMENIITTLFRAMKEAREGYEFIVTGMLFSFLGVVLREQLCHPARPELREKNRARVRQLKAVFRLISEHYDEPLTLEALANAAGFTPNYFCRFFRKVTKTSPIAYLNAYRVEQAALQLQKDDVPVTEAALSCGFNDVSYFIKTFRKQKGKSPREWLKAQKA